MMRKAFPLVRQLSKIPQSRQLWLSRPPTDFQKLIRDMDRRMEAFEREFFKVSPFRYLQPQLMQIDGVTNQQSNNFHVNVDVSGFQPEDIKISLKDGLLRIEAKMEKKSENGSRIEQHLVREFTVPANMDLKTVESYLHNGILTIEAAEKPGGTKIPISGGCDAETPKIKE